MKDTAVEMQDAGYGPFDTTSNQMSFNPYFFALQMPDNTRVQPTVGVVKPALNAAELPLGECLRGNVSFEVPQGQTPSYVLLTNPPTKWAIE
jgi:hypothetical protein